MASFYHALFLPSGFNGLFLAIATKPGIDFSPSGIGLMMFHVFQPFVNEQAQIRIPLMLVGQVDTTPIGDTLPPVSDSVDVSADLTDIFN